jgi:hypothetical protein
VKSKKKICVAEFSPNEMFRDFFAHCGIVASRAGA